MSTLTAPRFEFAKWLEVELDFTVSNSQARTYLHRLGGTWVAVKKGSYVDAREEPHSLQYETKFIGAAY